MTIPTLTLDPFDEAFLADPYAHHDILRDAGAVVWLEARQCFGDVQNAAFEIDLLDPDRFERCGREPVSSESRWNSRRSGLSIADSSANQPGRTSIPIAVSRRYSGFQSTAMTGL